MSTPRRYRLNGDVAHSNRQVPRPFLAEQPTRQALRDHFRRLEYAEIGLGLRNAKKYDLPRKRLRAIARTIATRKFKDRRTKIWQPKVVDSQSSPR